MKRFFLFLLLFLFPLQAAYAKGKSLVDYSQVFYIAGNVLFTDSTADDVSGATFRQNMTNPFVGAAGLGFRFLGFLYIGARYEHWFANRDFTSAGIPQEDTLKFSSIGGEVGFYRGNPRFYWTLTAGYFHTLSLSMESKRNVNIVTIYTRDPKPVTFQGRLTVGVKLNSRYSFRLEGGFRYANLGNLVYGSNPFLPGSADLNLSGPFVGAGLGIHF